MNGLEEWTFEEKQLPKIASRPPEPTLTRQSMPNISPTSYYAPSWLRTDDQSSS